MKADVVFRVDNSHIMGVGHLMRCLSLADALSAAGYQCTFISYPHKYSLNHLVNERSHHLIELKKRDDWVQDKSYGSWLGCTQEEDARECLNILSKFNKPIVVVDHYALDRSWEERISLKSKLIVVVDDLVNRPHYCQLLIDPTYERKISEYSELTNDSTKVRTGSDYCFIRKEFVTLRASAFKKRENTTSINHVLINFGGTDQDKNTLKVLTSLKNENYGGRITIVISSACHWLEELKSKIGRSSKIRLLIDTNNMPDVMYDADLAFGAMGGTTWERCLLGLPSICFKVVDNQSDIAKHLQKTGAVLLSDPIDLPKLVHSCITSGDDLSWWHEQSSCAFSICDGLGISRIVQEINQVA